MFNNNTMSLITDSDMLMNEARNLDFITVAAIVSDDDYPHGPNVYYAGVLVPQTELLMRWADGDQTAINIDYINYLQTQECDDMIVAIIAGMTKKNILVYIPKEEYDIYGAQLLNYMWNMYGIIMNTPFSQFSVDRNKIPLIISKFYLMGIMDANEYMAAYPYNLTLPDWVINKLAMDFHPFNSAASFEQYKDYFNNLNANKINNHAPNPPVKEKQLLYELIKKEA